MTRTARPATADLSYDDLLRRDDAPAGSTWGLFADADRGMAELAGPDHVRGAARSVDRGVVFSLDHHIGAFDPPMSRSRSAPTHTITAAHAESRDDLLDGFFLQASSHLDGLRHRRASGHGFYGGVSDDVIVPGRAELGIQAWADRPIVGRGVVLDVDGLLREEGDPPDHRRGPALSTDVLDRAARRQGCTVDPGDLVLVHTGWARWFLDAPVHLRAEVRDARRATGFRQEVSLPRWLWEHRVALFATDTFAVEVLPVRDDSPFLGTAPEDAGMMHQELIAKLGAPLGELWDLTALVEDSRATGRWDALVVVKPLALPGGVGSPCNATAIR